MSTFYLSNKKSMIRFLLIPSTLLSGKLSIERTNLGELSFIDFKGENSLSVVLINKQAININFF